MSEEGIAFSPQSALQQSQAAVDTSIGRACDALLAAQSNEGDWCFELEADCTIPSEYILMMHFTDEVDEELQRKIAVYLRAHQTPDGGWPLYHGAEPDISASVKTYWALRLAGDAKDAPHMLAARDAILARGGAARCNVFTRITMALFDQIPWRGIPFVPVEILLLPRWSPFHLSKVSYWSRTVIVPLSILCSLKARAKNPSGIDIRELFTVPPEQERGYFPMRSRMNRILLAIERTVRLLEPLNPAFVRRRAIAKAEQWFTERLNGTDGLGGIFPAMVNAYEAMTVLGYPQDDPRRVQAREAMRRLLVIEDDQAYCQPCFSPVWDTALSCLCLQEVNATMPSPRIDLACVRATSWLEKKQVLEGPADWRLTRPDLEPGGWAFQYNNACYPDLDDTSAVLWALHQGVLRQGDSDQQVDLGCGEAFRRGMNWVRGMQSPGGGFASFNGDKVYTFLDEIPFADHGALLDPPTADVSARCATVLALLGRPEDRETLHSCVDYLFAEQEENGSWYGRWGTNYIYGTWCALAALEHIDDERKREHVQRAVAWLKHVQRSDGSWGESNDSYMHPEQAGTAPEGTSFQTAWALLGLLAAGEADAPEVRRGIAWLLRTQQEAGDWSEDWYTAPGFPKVFYLRYHGYSLYFPLWALARYRRESSSR